MNPPVIVPYRSFRTYGGIKPAYLYLRYKLAPNQMAHRRELGIWLNAQGLLGEGAEIGVKEGKYSERILFHWRGRRLDSIDPWLNFSGETYRDKANVEQAAQDAYLEETRARLARFGGRSRIVRATSKEAAAQFPNGSLDFAYLDAQHHYEAVKEDIELWYPKIKPGGLLGGHDYYDRTEIDEETGMETVFEVKRAADEFARAERLVFFSTSKDKRPSWFVRKPGP